MTGVCFMRLMIDQLLSLLGDNEEGFYLFIFGCLSGEVMRKANSIPRLLLVPIIVSYLVMKVR